MILSIWIREIPAGHLILINVTIISQAPVVEDTETIEISTREKNTLHEMIIIHPLLLLGTVLQSLE